jgi:leucyl/phenylalanyl-tRNA---protein transferase
VTRTPRSPLPVFIDDDTPLPDTALTLGANSDTPGLLAVGGHVTPARLQESYARGIFPWFSAGQPVLWWAPDPRMVLDVRRFKVSRSFRKTLRAFIADTRCEIRIDHGFARVIEACATTPRGPQRGTWIVPAMVAAYTAWHQQGRVHSVETWIDGELAGGLYAVNLGRMVFGESMFSWQTDASKIALAALVALCRHHGMERIDCQQNTAHLVSLGACDMPREAFEAHVHEAVAQPDTGPWSYDPAYWSTLTELQPEPKPTFQLHDRLKP